MHLNPLGAFRHRHLIVSLLVATLFAGCHNPTAVRSELADARARWAAAAVSSYEITIARACFCAPAWTRPAILGVQDGKVVSARYADTGEPLPASLIQYEPTVDSMFAKIDLAISGKPASLGVTYDPDFGYPTSFVIDPSRAVADDEEGIYLSSFHPR